jgi:hypothetical protein
MKKTMWEKIYSALGFWKYYQHLNGSTYKIVYWCFPNWRKFDLFKMEVR